MKIYACAISATFRDSVSIQTNIFPAAIKAENKQEAIGKAIEMAHEQNPTDKGYSNHQVTVVEIPEQWIKQEKT